MKINSNKNTRKNTSGIQESERRIHSNGYTPSGPNTSTGYKPPNVGTSVEKK